MKDGALTQGSRGVHGAVGFDEALSWKGPRGYDGSAWVYVPPYYTDCRYILGTRGRDPLICVGINPSTAAPGEPDSTLRSVERAALRSGYDSFLMLNVYPQRTSDPDRLDARPNAALHAENMKAFRFALSLCPPDRRPEVWAAWGTLIEKRPYLWGMLLEMLAIGEEAGVRWLAFGRLTKAGHPRHPLYLPARSGPEPFDVRAYCAARGAAPGIWRQDNAK